MNFYRHFAKITLSIALLSGALWAEKSGGFLGIEAGFSKANFKQDIDATGHTHPGTNPATPSQPTPLVGNITADNILPAFYLKGGYKFMFGESGRFGVRPYVYFGYGYGSMKNVAYNMGASANFMPGLDEVISGIVDPILASQDSIFTGTGKTYYNHFFDYGVGADLLYNFVDNENESFGIFAGVAIGGETWVANGKEYKPNGGKGESYGNFQTILNIGLRGVLAKHHGIELGAKFYMLDSVIFDGSGYSPLFASFPLGDFSNMAQITSANINSTTTTMKRPYMISLAYTYNF